MAPERRLRFAAALLAGVFVLGVAGYAVLEGMTFVDAVYMTAITISTVGFREVTPLDDGGKMFTVVLILGGVGALSFGAASAIEFIVEGHLGRLIERRRVDRTIGHLSGHVVICGFGRVGRHLAGELSREHIPFVLVEADAEKALDAENAGYLVVRDDATEEEALLTAGVGRARAVVACVNSDADNVLCILTAKGISPTVAAIGRVKVEENEAKLRRAGADRVIAPTTIGGHRIAQLLTRPVVADFLERVAGSGGLEYSFEEVPVVTGSALEGTTLRAAAIRERHRCTVLAIANPTRGSLDTHPGADATLRAGDVLVVIGNADDVIRLRSHFTAS